MSNDRDIRRTRRFAACARWSLYGLFVLWAAFILATSCTVVRPQEFFDWMHENHNKHAVVFDKGRAVAVECPRLGRCEITG